LVLFGLVWAATPWVGDDRIGSMLSKKSVFSIELPLMRHI